MQFEKQQEKEKEQRIAFQKWQQDEMARQQEELRVQREMMLKHEAETRFVYVNYTWLKMKPIVTKWYQ